MATATHIKKTLRGWLKVSEAQSIMIMKGAQQRAGTLGAGAESYGLQATGN